MGLARYLDCAEFALSLTSVGSLVRLPALGIPDPNRYTFNPYGVINVAGNKLRVGDGFPSATWEWSEAGLSREVASRLQAFLAGQQSAYVYFRTPNNSEAPFANYFGVLTLPLLVSVGFNISAFEPMTWTFNALVAQ